MTYTKDTELLKYLVTGINNSYKPYQDTPSQEIKRIYEFGQHLDHYMEDYGFTPELFAEYMNIFCYTYCSEIIKMYGRLDYNIELFRAQIFMLFPESVGKYYEELHHLTQLAFQYSIEKNDAFYYIDRILVNVTDAIIGKFNVMLKVMD